VAARVIHLSAWADLLGRAAFHEAGHAVSALCFQLPLLEVVIRDDGSGRTDYCHRGRLAEAERWTITTYAGPAAELDEFGDQRADRGDLIAIANMLEKLQLDWDEDKLADLRHQARLLVKRERLGIRLVAGVLLQRRRLTAADLRRLVEQKLR
jgi:hypothetical protein